MRQAIFPEALKDAVAASGFSPAVRAGDFLFLTGATGGLEDGTMPTDPTTQAQNALSKVQSILEAAGADERHIVEMTTYHTDIATTFAPVQAIVEAVFSNPLPAWTAVEVAGLRRASAVVEFRFVAHVPERDAP
ncbi:MAG: Rid family hydrolase [Roseobacter sp.]